MTTTRQLGVGGTQPVLVAGTAALPDEHAVFNAEAQLADLCASGAFTLLDGWVQRWPVPSLDPCGRAVRNVARVRPLPASVWERLARELTRPGTALVPSADLALRPGDSLLVAFLTRPTGGSISAREWAALAYERTITAEDYRGLFGDHGWP